MPNPAFKNWTRSTAFSITLSQAGISQLLFMYSGVVREGRGLEDSQRFGDDQIFERRQAAYLSSRGLIRGVEREGYAASYYLTAEGRLMCQLLLAAGFETSIGVFENRHATTS
jgi:hypothetical protein